MALAEGLDIKLNTAIQEITYGPNGVEIFTNNTRLNGTNHVYKGKLRLILWACNNDSNIRKERFYSNMFGNKRFQLFSFVKVCLYNIINYFLRNNFVFLMKTTFSTYIVSVYILTVVIIVHRIVCPVWTIEFQINTYIVITNGLIDI